jgi:hypothetical protein
MNVSGSERTITGTGLPDGSGAPAKDRFVRRLCDGTTAAAAAPPPQPLWRSGGACGELERQQNQPAALGS